MKKLRLELDTLTVASFTTAAHFAGSMSKPF